MARAILVGSLLVGIVAGFAAGKRLAASPHGARITKILGLTLLGIWGLGLSLIALRVGFRVLFSASEAVFQAASSPAGGFDLRSAVFNWPTGLFSGIGFTLGWFLSGAWRE